MKKLWQFPLIALSCMALSHCSSLPGGDDASELAEESDSLLSEDPTYGTPPNDVEVDPKLDAALMVIDLDGDRRNILIQLNEQAAPKTVLNFKRNVKRGYYDGLAFHRVIPRFLIQTGDPLTRDELGRSNWGTGGPGYTVPPEPGLKHVRGAVAMARLGDAMNPSKESSGSQFYICLKDLPDLNGEYTVFGQVLQGLDVLTDLSKTEVDNEDVPVERIELRAMKLVSSKSRFAKPKLKKKKKDPKSKPDEEKGGFEKFFERIW